jgi:periplasmic protein TonB
MIAGPLLTTDDYPRDARAARAEGRVSFRLEISPQGRVVGCAITGSSGFASIDRATCRLLRARARYRPARDAAGNAVAGTDNGWVDWRLPPGD